MKQYILIFFFLLRIFPSFAQSCITSTITSPTPFMGNNDEIFKLEDGSLWQVKYEYSYLYEYYPAVKICPSQGKLVIGQNTLNVIPLTKSGSDGPANAQAGVRVIFKKSGCRSYFLADGDSGGIYLLEWYGGYDPDEGDEIVGNIKSYGFKDVFYPKRNRTGRVYVDDYMLSRSRATEKIRGKCN